MSKEFDEWLSLTEKDRTELIEYGKVGGVTLDPLKSIEKADATARLLAEAESFLSLEREKAMWDTRKKYPDLNSREREVIERSTIRGVQLIVDSLRICYQSCKSRYFAYRG